MVHRTAEESADRKQVTAAEPAQAVGGDQFAGPAMPELVHRTADEAIARKRESAGESAKVDRSDKDGVLSPTHSIDHSKSGAPSLREPLSAVDTRRYLEARLLVSQRPRPKSSTARLMSRLLASR